MATARQFDEWSRTAILLSMLEGCRQQNVPLDPLKFIPPHLRPPPEKSTKQQRSEFRGFLAQGAEVRHGNGKRS